MSNEQIDISEIIEVAIGRLANSITPDDTCRGVDAAGGSVGSLTEAVMGVTAGLIRIAESIESLADAVRESR